MPLKALLFISLFAGSCAGAIFMPIWGVLGYVGHYCVGPEDKWWAAPFHSWGIRYSFTLASVTAVGIGLNWNKLRFGPKLLSRQEWLAVGFVGLVWFSTWVGGETVGRYTVTDHPSMKITKLLVFAFMLSHVVVDLKNLNRLLWVLVAGSLILGLDAYSVPRSAFDGGRLNRVGGPDFQESNVLAAFLSCMLPIIGIQFLRAGRLGKVVCFVTAAFAANAIVLTRSRSAVVGLGAGILTALVMAPKEHRRKIVLALIAAVAGGVYLTDPQFWNRASTITLEGERRDSSAQNRIEIWQGAARMVVENPLGVGAGNFHQNIGKYAPRHPDRDAHNTFVRAAGDMGIPGLVVFTVLVVHAFLVYRSVRRRSLDLPPPYRDEFAVLTFGLTVSLVALIVCGLFITLVYNEAMWWALVLPVCLQRTLANVEEDLPAQAGLAGAPRLPAVTGRVTKQLPYA